MSSLESNDSNDDVSKKAPDSLSAREAANKDHVKGWDGQRGFFTIIVVLAHMNCPLARNAWIIVGFFFTLSGLLITSLTLKVYEKKGEIGIFLFYQRRIARLIPSALLVILACCVYVVVMKVFSPSSLTGIDIYWLRRDMLWATFYSSNWEFMIKGEDYFAQYDDLSLLRHYWSLAIEEQYYICWPVLLLVWTTVIPPIINYFIALGSGTADSNSSTNSSNANEKSVELLTDAQKKLRFKYLLVSLLIGDLIVVIGSWGYQLSLLANDAPYYVLHYSTIVHLKEFALGGAAAALVKLTPALDGLMFSTSEYVPKFSFRARIIFEVIILLGHVYLLTIALAPIWKDMDELSHWQFSYGSMTIALTIAVTNILQVIQSKEMIAAERKYFPVSDLILSSDFLALLGKISYQTYLWHVPVIVWTAAAYHDEFSFEYLLYAAFVFAAIYGLSILLSAYFEFPTLKALMAVKDPRKVIAGMFICMLLLAGAIAVVTSDYEDPYAYEAVEKENMNAFKDLDSTAVATLHAAPVPMLLGANASAAVLPQQQLQLPQGQQQQQQGQQQQPQVDPLDFILHSGEHLAECRRIESSTPFVRFKYVTLISELFASVRTEGEFKDYQRNLFNVKYHAMVRDRLELKEYLPGLQQMMANNTLPPAERQNIKVMVVKGLVKSGYKSRPVCSELEEFRSMIRPRDADRFYYLYVHDSRFEDSHCPGYPAHGVIDTAGTHFVAIDMRRVLASQPPSDTFARLTRDELDEFWQNVNDESFKIHITDIRYMVSAMIESAVDMMPELLPFFKCSFFADHKNKYIDSRDLNAINTQSTVLVKRRIAYLGNSVASRYGYLVETARSQLLGKCTDDFAALDVSDPHSALSIALFETLMNFAVGNAAKHGNDVVKNTMADRTPAKEPKELQRIRKYLKENEISAVVIEDSDYLHQIIIETNGAFARLGDAAEKVKLPAKVGFFSTFVLFLNVLREELGVTKVYFHDLHVWTGISRAQMGPYAEEVGKPRIGYQMVLAMMETLFQHCEVHLKNWDGALKSNSICFTSDQPTVAAAAAEAADSGATVNEVLLRKLVAIRNSLTFLAESHLSCPQPKLMPSNIIICPKDAWGYDPILSDGMHPAGAAGDFVGTHMLHQLTQDLYLEQFLDSPAAAEISAFEVKSFPSTFAAYSATKLPGRAQADYEAFFTAMSSFARTTNKCSISTKGTSKLEPPFDL